VIGSEEETTGLDPESLTPSPIPHGSTNISKCGCPEKLVSLKDSETVFYDLDQQESYFPMVSTIDPNAFFALPPASITPTRGRIDEPIQFYMTNQANAESGTLSSASIINSLNGEPDDLEKHEPDHDIYNETFSERGNDPMEMDELTHKSLTPSPKSNGTVNSQHSADHSLDPSVAPNSIADAPFSVSNSKSLHRSTYLQS
jgi:hypothetical protein